MTTNGTTSQIIATLVSEFQAEIELVCSLVNGSTTLLQPSWLPGTELTIGVPPHLWQHARSRTLEGSASSDMIHSCSISNNGQIIYLRMGQDVWQNTRCDRFRGSRILSAMNDIPADSTNRLQTIKLVRGSGDGVLHYEGGDVQSQHRYFRLMAHFLRMCVGFCPKDIGKFIGRISRESSEPIDASLVISKGSSMEERLMLAAGCKAIAHAQEHKYWTKMSNVLTPKGLTNLDDVYDISATNRSFENSWAVLVFFSGNKAREALSQMQPSFFMWAPDVPHFKAQIHIIETPICTLRFPVLLGFDEKPGEGNLEKALGCLRSTLGLDVFTTKTLATEPFIKEDSKTWFRADGMLDRDFKDKGLSPHLRQALTILRGTDSDVKLELITDANLFVPTRKPIRWILWVRQSNEDGKRARDTMPRQLTTLMTSLILGEGFREGDQVVICCELCSSSKHPLTDRRLWNTVRGMRDMSINLLTVNPDRMTRRADEVDAIREFLASTGGCWYTQGVIKEDHSIDHWFIVDRDIVPLIKKQLSLGKALHGGYYARQNHTMTIINDAVDRLDSVPTQINAAAAIVRHSVQAHGYQRICLISRTAPEFQAGKKDAINTSLIRQSCLLSIMFGACDLAAPGQVIRLELRGYSNEEVLNRLDSLPRNALINGNWVKNVKTLIVTTSIDRLVGSLAQYARFRRMSCNAGWGAMAMLWDYRTEPNACTALHLDKSHEQIPVVAAWDKVLKEQKRAPRHNLNLPILQPLIWGLGREQSLSSGLHAFRHVQNVEAFKSAMKTSMYQGGVLIAPELSERPADNRGLSDERKIA